MSWLKRKIREWLGVEDQVERLFASDRSLNKQLQWLGELTHDLVSIGVDVHFKEPHMILIYSRLNGGQIREIRADFRNVQDLNEFVKQLQARFNTDSVVWDKPHGYPW